MRQVLSRKPSSKSMKTQPNQLNTHSHENSSMLTKNRNATPNKKQFINVTSRDKHSQSVMDLRASITSMPVSVAPSRIETIAHLQINRNQSSFVGRRSQSCASIMPSRNPHRIVNTARPVTVIVKERIVPMKFIYNQGRERLEQQGNSIPINHFQSAFQHIPSKKDILFGELAQKRSLAQTPVHSPMVYKPVESEFSFRPTTAVKPLSQHNGNFPQNMQFIRKATPKEVSGPQTARFFSERQSKLAPTGQRDILHTRVPSFHSQTAYAVETRFQQKVIDPVPVVNASKRLELKASFGKETIIDSNYQIIQQIDRNIIKIDKSMDKIFEKPFSMQLHTSLEQKEMKVSLPENPASSQLLGSILNPESTVENNRQSLVASRANSMASHAEQDSLTLSRFKQFRQFKEFSEFKERASSQGKRQFTDKENVSTMSSSRCQYPCKHIRQLLEDYQDIKYLRGFNSVKGIKQRETYKLRLIDNIPKRNYYG